MAKVALFTVGPLFCGRTLNIWRDITSRALALVVRCSDVKCCDSARKASDRRPRRNYWHISALINVPLGSGHIGSSSRLAGLSAYRRL
jgi:hypothetical protein